MDNDLGRTASFRYGLNPYLPAVYRAVGALRSDETDPDMPTKDFQKFRADFYLT